MASLRQQSRSGFVDITNKSNNKQHSNSILTPPKPSPSSMDINHHHHHHNHPPRQQQQQEQQLTLSPMKPFYLFSAGGQSIKTAALEAKKRPGLAKSKVNVVSIICRDKLNGSIRNELVRTLLGPNKSCKHLKLPHHLNDDLNSSEDNNDEFSSEHESLPRPASDLDVSIYETQVIGNLNCDSNLVVLSLNSILEADKLCQIVKPPEVITNFLFSPDWPLRSQNLIKTLHIMLSVSHVVVFYSPDLSLDPNIVQTLKILEVLRLKSQTRITDLLETIEFKKYLPEKWVKQGRLCTPRALFVFGTDDCGVTLKQSDIVSTKRNLEDQIYMLLKKTDLICQLYQKSSPISLPERDEFVFILNGHCKPQTIKNTDLSFTEGPSNTLESFYSELINSLGYEDTVLTTQVDNDQCDKPLGTVASRRRSIKSYSRRKNHNNQQQPPDEGPEQSLGRFRKFLQRHLSDIRLQSEQHGRQSNVILPTYENLLAALANLADLFFPIIEDELGLPSALQCWRKPDERRFVDIYGLLNYEESFSKTYCYQVRETAFAMFSDRLISMPARNQPDFSKLLQPVMQYYLTHARGPASLTYRDLLEQDCNNHWLETRNNNKKGNLRALKNIKPFSVSRRPDEIILNTSCECCGNKSSFRLTTKDRKALDSVYISRLNRTAESS